MVNFSLNYLLFGREAKYIVLELLVLPEDKKKKQAQQTI